MRKDRLTLEQSNERAHVVQRLSAAGWQEQDEWHGLEQGHDVPHEAKLTYAGPMTLEVKYQAPMRTLDLWVGSLGFLQGRRLRMKCPESLPQLLDVIVGFQDRISAETFREHVRSILQVCPDTYAMVGAEDEERFVRVVDEKKEE
jgi:hypothetical protein